jgi:Holliday junction resolvase RusA-like endonuclease
MNDPLLEVALEWKPQVKERPRFANGRVYTPKKTLHAEEDLRRAFLHAAPDWVPYYEPCHVEWTFTNSHVGIVLRSHSDYEQRQLRGDLDNYVKMASDAMNGVLFDDDKRVVRAGSVKL